MSSQEYEVSSEIYSESDFKSEKTENGNTISRFTFVYPDSEDEEKINRYVKKDKDGDLILPRKKKGVIEIEHSKSTVLKLVGLQVWRGALLLADYILHNRNFFKDKIVLELGSGVGLTSIAAAIYCKNVICTDINMGGILDVISSNAIRNESFLGYSPDTIKVMELDFKANKWPDELNKNIKNVDVILAADVIYDDDITEAFILTLEKIFNCSPKSSPKKTVLIALEKRYVFTVADLETAAPCFEHFLSQFEKIKYSINWKMTSIPIDFPKFFNYERVKELLLLEVTAF